MRRWLLILLLAIPLIHVGLLRSPEPVDASGDVVLATGQATLANTKLSLANSYAFFDFSTDMTPWIGETIEICPATAASKHYCIRGLVSTVGTGETYGSEQATGWSNSSSNSFETFTSSVLDITSAINTSGSGRCLTNSFNPASGRLVKLTANLTLNSGTAPAIGIGSNSSGSYSGLVSGPVLSSGSNTSYITSVSNTQCVGLYVSSNDDFSLSGFSATLLTAPSTTGHWIKKSAASSTNGDAWGYKHASFLANDSAGYWWRIIQARPSGTYIDGNASIASSNIRLATNDGGSMIEIVGKDLSSYSGVDAYTPPTTNLQLHLKADSGCYTDAWKTTACANDGDKAYTWADQSANGNDAVQATEGYIPLYKTSIVGSLPAIRFDGSDDKFMLSTGLGMLRNISGSTIYAVSKRSGSAPINSAVVIAIETAASGSSRFLLSYLSSSNLIRSGGRRLDADSFFGVNSRVSDTSVHLISATAKYSSSDIYQYVDGMLDGFNTAFQSDGLTSDTDSNAIYIGGESYVNSYINGDIYEILVYNTAHDDATRTRIERYLAGKWGITTYQPTYAGTSPAKYLICLYSSGGTACGYMGAQGGGIALESDLLSGWDFTSGWSGATCAATVTDANTFTLSAASGCIDKTYSALDIGKLYYATLDGTPSAGTLSLRGNSSDPIWCTGNSCTGYGTATTTTNDKVLVYNASGGIGATSDITSMTLQPVTDISQSGVHLHSTPSAYDRKMARKDSGFNPNAVTSYKIYQVAPAGYELDSILQEDGQPIWGNEGINTYLQQEG